MIYTFHLRCNNNNNNNITFKQPLDYTAIRNVHILLSLWRLLLHSMAIIYILLLLLVVVVVVVAVIVLLVALILQNILYYYGFHWTMTMSHLTIVCWMDFNSF